MLRAGEARPYWLSPLLVDGVVDISGRAGHDRPVLPRAVDSGPEPLVGLLVNGLPRGVVVAGQVEGDLLAADGKLGPAAVDGAGPTDAVPGLLRLVLGRADDEPEGSGEGEEGKS